MTRIIFSSDELSPQLDDRARQKLWVDILSDHLCSAEVSFFPDVPFYSRSEFLRFGEISITQLDANIQHAVRTKQHAATDTRGDYIIGTMLNGTRSLLKQDGRESVREAGQAMLYTNAQPLAAQHDSPVAFRAASVPYRLLAERVPRFEDLVVTPLQPSPALHYLEQYLSILSHSQVDGDPALEERIAAHLVDLIALALGATGDSARLATIRGLRAARVQEISLEIRKRFAEPGFSPAQVAQSLGLSPRYVNELLYETGSTFADRVMELRLQKARAMLADRRCDRMKVIDIAYECGFGEVSYFNRCFRRRFGAAPTQYRGNGYGIGRGSR